MTLGRDRRLARIVDPDGPTFVLPLDDGLISGPTALLSDPRELLRCAIAGGATSVLGYPGVLRRCADTLRSVGYMQNLTGSTVHAHHTTKVLLCGVGDALRNGADGVAFHINISANAQPAMLRDLGSIAEQCRQLGMPLVVIAYPRRDSTDGDDNYVGLRQDSPQRYAELVAHCARVAAELGADVVKVPYTGSTELFEIVVQAALGVPVLVAGGSPRSDDEALTIAVDGVRAGAAGVAYGRQTFVRPVSEVAGFVQRVMAAMREVACPRDASSPAVGQSVGFVAS